MRACEQLLVIGCRHMIEEEEEFYVSVRVVVKIEAKVLLYFLC